VIGIADLVQRKHSVLRNYPVLGHLRFLLEGLRPELQQYFIERNFDGRPFDRDVRSIVYQRAKGTEAEEPFGTERNVYDDGYEFFGCRTKDGEFDESEFSDKSAHESVKCVSLKLSQGAKPGMGGVLPGGKVNAEIAKVRDVPAGKTVVSPPYHRVFSTPREL